MEADFGPLATKKVHPLDLLDACKKEKYIDVCGNPEFWKYKIKQDFPGTNIKNITKYKDEYFILYSQSLRNQIEEAWNAEYNDPKVKKMRQMEYELEYKLEKLLRRLKDTEDLEEREKLDDLVDNTNMSLKSLRTHLMKQLKQYNVDELRRERDVLKMKEFNNIRDVEPLVNQRTVEKLLNEGPGVYESNEGAKPGLAPFRLYSLGFPVKAYVFSWYEGEDDPEAEEITRMYEVSMAPQIPDSAIKWAEDLGLTKRQAREAFGVL